VAALRRKGSLGDAAFRAALSAAIALGLARWFHVLEARVPALYDPDPSLPASLATLVPGVDAVWGAARGAFVAAAAAAAAVLAWRSAFFRTRAGRALGLAAVVLALMPTEMRSASESVFVLASGLLFAGWFAVCAFGLLRDHAAAWVLFGVLAFGGRAAIDLLGQPASADRSAGAVAVLLLAVSALALLAGRGRGRAAPPTAGGVPVLSAPLDEGSARVSPEPLAPPG
jgi:hypothetical protein